MNSNDYTKIIKCTNSSQTKYDEYLTKIYKNMINNFLSNIHCDNTYYDLNPKIFQSDINISNYKYECKYNQSKNFELFDIYFMIGNIDYKITLRDGNINDIKNKKYTCSIGSFIFGHEYKKILFEFGDWVVRFTCDLEQIQKFNI